MQVRKPFRFHAPSSILVVGPSGCGKTVFTEKLLLENADLFETRPTQVHYCYGAWQDRFQPMQDRGVLFHEGIPDHQALVKWFPQGQGVLVLDDLMNEGSNNKRVLDWFTKHSHHQNVTVLYLCQDMFPVGKYAKIISSNAHYIVAFKNPRDQLRTSLWVFGVGFAPGVVRSTTVVKPRFKRREMDAYVSKALPRSDTGCQVKSCLPHCFGFVGRCQVEDYQVEGCRDWLHPCLDLLGKNRG